MTENQKPLVNCVMVTGKTPERVAFAKLARLSFREQTYARKRLVIITTAASDDWADETSENVVVVRVADPATPLGTLRNLGLSKCLPGYVVQWDDDDWSHPERIAWQQGWTAANEASLLRYQIRYSLLRDAAFVMRYDSRGIPDTLMHPLTANQVELAYEAVGKHEDSRFRNKYFAGAEALLNSDAIFPGPAMHIRFYHGFNTWDEQHVMRDLAGEDHRGEWRVPLDQAVYLKKVVLRYMAVGLTCVQFISGNKLG